MSKTYCLIAVVWDESDGQFSPIAHRISDEKITSRDLSFFSRDIWTYRHKLCDVISCVRLRYKSGKMAYKYVGVETTICMCENLHDYAEWAFDRYDISRN